MSYVPRLLWAAVLLFACVYYLTLGTVAYSQSFQLARPTCYLNNWDWQVRSLASGARTLLWWCETAQGMRRYSRSENVPQSALEVSAKDNDSLWALDQAKANRPHTGAELALIAAVEAQRGPRCFAQTSGTATTVPVYAKNPDGTRSTRIIARIVPDAPLNCYLWVKPSTVRYCEEPGLNGYARCRISRPPQEGWPE